MEPEKKKSGLLIPKEWAATFKVNSDNEHPPVTINIRIPKELAFKLMQTPVTSVTIAIGQSGSSIYDDRTGLIDFK